MRTFIYLHLSAVAAVVAVVAVAAVATAAGVDDVDSRDSVRCKFYNTTCISHYPDEASAQSCSGTVTCPDPGHVCYAVWSDDTAGGLWPKGKLMGCIVHERRDDCREHECVEKSGLNAEHGYHFCCCVGDLCNKTPPEKLKPYPYWNTANSPPPPSPPSLLPVLVGVPVGVSVLIVGVAVAMCYVRKSSGAELANPGVGAVNVIEAAPAA